jgi:hypothetical protein
MKKLSIHVGVGISLVVLTAIAAFVFAAIVNWLIKNKIIGASWFATLGDLEFAVAVVLILVLWLISLFGMMTTWYSRFYTAAKVYVLCVLGMLILGSASVAPIGFISSWFYNKNIVLIGAIFRLVEIVYCCGILGVIALGIFGMVRAMFTPVTSLYEQEEKTSGWVKLLIIIMLPFSPHDFICIYPKILLDVIRWSLIITATIATVLWLWHVHWILGIIIVFPAQLVFRNFFGFLTLPFYAYTIESRRLRKQFEV